MTLARIVGEGMATGLFLTTTICRYGTANNKGCFAADAAKRQEPANTPLVEQARIKPLI